MKTLSQKKTMKTTTPQSNAAVTGNPRQNRIIRTGIEGEAGLTLIEMLTVMAIILILGSTAISNFSAWLYRYQADSVANKLYFDLMAAKQLAIRSNSTVIVTFDSGTASYSVHNDLDRDDSVDAGETVKNVPLENDVNYGIVSGTLGVWGSAVSNGISLNGATQVKFFSWGQADRSGALYLTPNSDVATGEKSRQRAIKIIQATGNIEAMRFDNGGSPGPWS